MRWYEIASVYRAYQAELAKGPALVAIQQVNNETGVIQPLGRLADRIREAGSLLLADCAQSASKLELPDADFVALRGSHSNHSSRKSAELIVMSLCSALKCLALANYLLWFNNNKTIINNKISFLNLLELPWLLPLSQQQKLLQLHPP